MLGDDHPQTLESISNLAVIRRELGDLQGAEELHGQALVARQRLLGDDHPNTRWSMTKLASLRHELERPSYNSTLVSYTAGPTVGRPA